jgi:hypothetical protein
MEKGIMEALEHKKAGTYSRYASKPPPFYNSFYFNIKNGEVTVVYQPCLP